MIEGLFVGLLLALLTLLYLYLYRTYTFWTRRGVKQITPIPFFGSFLPVFLGLKNHGEVYHEIYYKYPDSDAVGYYQFLSPKLMIRNPALVKRVLISDFSSFRDNEIYTNTKVDPLMELNPFLCRGDTWKPARSTFVAGLTASKLKSYLPLMKDTLTHLDDFLASNLDKELEAKDFSNSFFMTLVSNTAYGVDANCFTDPNAAFRKMVELLSKTNWQKFHNVIIIFFLQSLKTWLGYSFAPKPMQDFGAKVMREVTETRVKTGTRRNDYIQCYLDRNNTVEEKVFELSNHAISFFIGGMETSSITASNAVYELALHQDYQDRLYQELKEAYAKTPDMDYDTLLGLPYLNQIFEETGRKNHVLYSLPKVCTKYSTFVIDGNEVDLFPGQLVMIPSVEIQMDAKYYPDPDVFDPERFNEENKSGRPEVTYMPFGEGPRICAGMQFGILQVKIFLCHLVYHYRILPTSRSAAKPSYSKHSYFVIPNHNQFVKLVRRNH
ncbi:cytochrome P450 6k1-like isoform X2 [Homalodisca vitripennis]|uniref:cytochrome P450 6k1-like isoform X1 n=1 Tax=Homalodisca vitripennis TaxID=197043 RepID=UPI001EEBC915|nr:cytochrome P450 6k1-like isoform X1 [Homalodisca vitripennis]XP_046680884.1 cytochrome P450 6k1-like isoform X2 [Homalodisca vitripennis]